MAADVTLIFNPDCSKCRGAKALLEERGVAFVLRPYLEQPLSTDELADLTAQLSADAPRDLVRGELDDGADLLAILATDPARLQRPIVVRDDRAIIARPPERLLDLW